MATEIMPAFSAFTTNRPALLEILIEVITARIARNYPAAIAPYTGRTSLYDFTDCAHSVVSFFQLRGSSAVSFCGVGSLLRMRLPIRLSLCGLPSECLLYPQEIGVSIEFVDSLGFHLQHG